MTTLRRCLNRMGGWALSFVFHGAVAAFAALSVGGSQLEGSGQGGDAGPGAPGAPTSFAVSFRGGDPVIPGTLLPETAQYGPLSSEETAFEAEAEELPAPTIQYDVFAVGPRPVKQGSSQAFDAPSPPRPGANAGRLTRLPAASSPGEEQDGRLDFAASGGGPGEGRGTGSSAGSGDGQATGVYTPTPPYPGEARRQNIEGWVRVELAVAADGSCVLRRIIESSGVPLLDQAVEETVRRWKYRSAEEDGRPALTSVRVRFVFKLGRPDL